MLMARAMINAKIDVSSTSKPEFIEVPSAKLSRLIPTSLRKSMYIRRLYWPLLTKILASKPNSTTIVTGNPGMG